MSFPLSNLNAVYSLGGSDLLALLKMASVDISVDSVDAAGLAMADEYAVGVKRGSRHEFSVMQLNGLSVPDTNLDMSVWAFGGTAYLGSVKSGAINGTVRTKDVSGIAAIDKVPAFRRRAWEVTTDRMVFSSSLTASLASVVGAGVPVVVHITFGTCAFQAQMLLTAAKLTVQDEETTMEQVTFKGQATPTSPSDGSLLGVFCSTAQLALMLKTCASGGESFSTSGGVLGLLTRLNVQFADGAVTKCEGTLDIQGPLTVAST